MKTTHYSPADITVINNCVAETPMNVSKGLRQAAKKLNRKYSGVQAKYYAIKGKAVKSVPVPFNNIIVKAPANDLIFETAKKLVGKLSESQKLVLVNTILGI